MLRATTRQLVTTTNTSYINAHSVATLLYQRTVSFTDRPITVVLDNARNQHCRFIKELAPDLGIELLFLPAYSPNLNLIERLWQIVKKKCFYSQYYEKFADFSQEIEDSLANISGALKEQLTNLLTLNFQTFEKVSL